MMLRPLTLIAALLLTGCAGWRQKVAPQDAIAEERAARRTAAVQAFEQSRDAMQLEAALDYFDQGDNSGCESRLAALVERRPDFLPARLRLAEMLWFRGDAAQAEKHYRAVLALQPDNVEAHFGLGTLLEDSGRSTEAAQHLATAPSGLD